ncbi:MAG: hypothetical protein WBX25_07750, partial [Rhodomicrobium sp.]
LYGPGLPFGLGPISLVRCDAVIAAGIGFHDAGMACSIGGAVSRYCPYPMIPQRTDAGYYSAQTGTGSGHRAYVAPPVLKAVWRTTCELARKIIEIEAGVIPAYRATPKPPAVAVYHLAIGVFVKRTTPGFLCVIVVM